MNASHPPGAPPPLTRGLKRDSAFAYRCRACQRCCQHKLIRINPYEALHLSRALGLSTTQFLARYVDRETSFLKLGDQGKCVFLDPQLGCGVHAHRPLVCRLYPLGRHVSGEGAETFSTVVPHPETDGVYGGEGTVGDYLASQQAEPFIAAVDRLLALFHELQLRAAEAAAGGEGEDIDWLDIDLVLRRVAGTAAGCPADGIEPTLDAYCLTISSTIHAKGEPDEGEAHP